MKTFQDFYRNHQEGYLEILILDQKFHTIYDHYDDNIVDYYLNGDLKPKKPILKKIKI